MDVVLYAKTFFVWIGVQRVSMMLAPGDAKLMPRGVY